MSNVNVAAIRAALRKATPGPWDVEGSMFGHDDSWIGQTYVGMEGVDAEQAAADAELVVLLRNNAEALLDAVERANEDAAEYAPVLDRCSELLTGVANALNGPPPPLTSWSHHDLPEKAQAVVDALKRQM